MNAMQESCHHSTTDGASFGAWMNAPIRTCWVSSRASSVMRALWVIEARRPQPIAAWREKSQWREAQSPESVPQIVGKPSPSDMAILHTPAPMVAVRIAKDTVGSGDSVFGARTAEELIQPSHSVSRLSAGGTRRVRDASTGNASLYRIGSRHRTCLCLFNRHRVRRGARDFTRVSR